MADDFRWESTPQDRGLFSYLSIKKSVSPSKAYNYHKRSTHNLDRKYSNEDISAVYLQKEENNKSPRPPQQRRDWIRENINLGQSSTSLYQAGVLHVTDHNSISNHSQQDLVSYHQEQCGNNDISEINKYQDPNIFANYSQAVTNAEYSLDMSNESLDSSPERRTVDFKDYNKPIFRPKGKLQGIYAEKSRASIDLNLKKG